MLKQIFIALILCVISFANHLNGMFKTKNLKTLHSILGKKYTTENKPCDLGECRFMEEKSKKDKLKLPLKEWQLTFSKNFPGLIIVELITKKDLKKTIQDELTHCEKCKYKPTLNW